MVPTQAVKRAIDNASNRGTIVGLNIAFAILETSDKETALRVIKKLINTQDKR